MTKTEKLKILRGCKEFIGTRSWISSMEGHNGLCWALKRAGGKAGCDPKDFGIRRPKDAGDPYWFPRDNAGTKIRIKLVNDAIRRLVAKKVKRKAH